MLGHPRLPVCKLASFCFQITAIVSMSQSGRRWQRESEVSHPTENRPTRTARTQQSTTSPSCCLFNCTARGITFSSFFSHSLLNCRLWQLTSSPKVRSLCKVRGELLPFVLDSRFASNTRWHTRVVGLSFQPQVKPVLAGLKATAGTHVAIFGRLRT